MILGQFFLRTEDRQVRAIEVTSWRRVLIGCSAAEILTAWEAYQAQAVAGGGRVPKPSPHELRRLVMRERAATNPAPRLAAPSERDRVAARAANRVSAEDAARILERVGFTPRRLRVMTDAESFFGKREPAKVDPDQSHLPGTGGASEAA